MSKKSLRDKVLGDPKAVAELKKADAELHENQKREEAAGIDYETPEYQRLNTAANEAAKRVPWHRR